jgi:dolichol-phosphate mannosyltransferase
MPDTVLFVPTYNERDNIELLHAQIEALPLDLDIVYLDDSSPDGTGEVLDAIAARSSRVRVIHRPGKAGIGSAHRDGIRHAYRGGYRILVTMDSDLTHSPSRIAPFVHHARDHDVVLGSRFLRDESLAGWSPLRSFLTHLGHFLTRTLLGVPYDATGGFRVYRLDRIDPRVFELTRSDSYAFFFESLYLMCRYGVTVKELPIDLPRRTYGHSKMRCSDVIASLRTLIRLFVTSPLTTRTVRGFRIERLRRVASAPAEDL